MYIYGATHITVVEFEKPRRFLCLHAETAHVLRCSTFASLNNTLALFRPLLLLARFCHNRKPLGEEAHKVNPKIKSGASLTLKSLKRGCTFCEITLGSRKESWRC